MTGRNDGQMQVMSHSFLLFPFSAHAIHAAGHKFAQ